MEHSYEYRERMVGNEDGRRPIRGRVDEIYDRARGYVEDVYDHTRHGARRKAEEAEGRRKAEEAAKEAADHARGMGDRVKDTMGYARDRAEDVGERIREVPEYIGDRVRDAAEYARDTVGNVAGYTRDKARDSAGYVSEKTGDMSDRVRGTAENGRYRAEEVGSHARGRLGELGDSTKERLEELTDAARARMEDVKERVKESVGVNRGRTQDTWHQGTGAVKQIGDTGHGGGYCMSLPTDRICARHVFFLVPLLLLATAFWFRHRHPDKWQAHMNKLMRKKEMMGHKMRTTKEQAMDRASNAKERAMEALREDRGNTRSSVENIAGKHLDKANDQAQYLGKHTMERAGEHTDRAGQHIQHMGQRIDPREKKAQ